MDEQVFCTPVVLVVPESKCVDQWSPCPFEAKFLPKASFADESSVEVVPEKQSKIFQNIGNRG